MLSSPTSRPAPPVSTINVTTGVALASGAAELDGESLPESQKQALALVFLAKVT